LPFNASPRQRGDGMESRPPGFRFLPRFDLQWHSPYWRTAVLDARIGLLEQMPIGHAHKDF